VLVDQQSDDGVEILVRVAFAIRVHPVAQRIDIGALDNVRTPKP